MNLARAACVVLALAALLAFPILGARADEGWLVDFKAAKEKSAADGKDVLMEFTGSDWCPPCKALKKAVFDTEHFKTKAPENFILLKLDNPNDKSKQTPDEIEQYKKLSAEYKISGVPTIVLADSQGRPYAQLVGFGGQQAEAYLEGLVAKKSVRQKRDEFLAKAEKAQGVEKAKLLDQAVAEIDGELKVTFYKDLVDQIVSLDAKNEAGLKEKYETIRNDAEFKTALQDVTRSLRGGDRAAAIKSLDDLIAAKNPKGESLQQALFLKANLLFATDKAKAKETLEAAAKVAPETRTARQIEQILKQVFTEKPAEEPKPEPKPEPKAEKPAKN